MKLPQLSLRDLFWLVALVAMGCGWWLERTKMNDQLIRVSSQLTVEKQNHAPIIHVDTESWRERRLNGRMEITRDGDGHIHVEMLP